MARPKCIDTALALLQAERAPLTARLDALDLAILNLERVFVAEVRSAPATRRLKRPRLVVVRQSGKQTDAAARRTLLLSEIGKAETGLTIGELKKRLPKISGPDRSNALHALKVAGEIRRTGNTWTKVA